MTNQKWFSISFFLLSQRYPHNNRLTNRFLASYAQNPQILLKLSTVFTHNSNPYFHGFLLSYLQVAVRLWITVQVTFVHNFRGLIQDLHSNPTQTDYLFDRQSSLLLQSLLRYRYITRVVESRVESIRLQSVL